MHNVRNVAIKELFGFFSSITAFLFFGAFLAVTLFVFFWVDTFFARNIADVRPMFEWMPVLLIFLVSSLTMRMWSEERRAGTIEFLLTLPVSNVELVLGKFAACLSLITIALILTLPIPITVAFLGQLDWGPVFGGYLATLFLAAAYTAIGLNISARTDNQIVSLILSVLVCGLFLLVGSEGVTSLFNSNIGEVLKLFGSGSRFQSITRGVIDFRDLYYYICITGVFLSLNILSLERLRWSGNSSNPRHTKWNTITALCIANLVACNFWLQQIAWARVDLTEGQIYSISPATRKYISRLTEPLVIRGYFSKKTHPLLQPLVPKIRDLLKEYAIASNGKIRVEIIDPLEKPELEKEASEKYDIKPVVFQTASKYQAALTNSYFDLLILYGDQFQKLSWKDLIEVKARSMKDVEVDLRNPEYDITSTIKKVMYSYQGSGNPFLNIDKPVKFTGYISKDASLPRQVLTLKQMLVEILETLKKESNGKLSVQFIDPDADGGKVARQIQSSFGFRPMALSVLDPRSFWFYMTLQCADQVVRVPLPDAARKDALDRSIQSALKRFSKGFLKTVGLYVPYYMPKDQFPQEFSTLRQYLSDSYAVQDVDFEQGLVPSDIDLLLIVDPRHFTNKQVFAVDQFLMKGGTVMLATSPFEGVVDKTIRCNNVRSGLEDWLKNSGIDIENTMVLDSQNLPLPIPVRREIRGFTIQDTRLAPYPYFIDVGRKGMDKDNGLTAGLDEVLVTWSSPISIDKEKNKQRHVLEVLHSSPESWTAKTTFVEPKYSEDQPLGVPVSNDKGAQLLAVCIEGSFDSYFKNKKSPLLDANTAPGSPSQQPEVVSSIIDRSPDSGRIILFGSNSFLNDKILWLATQSLSVRYLKPVELIHNAVDWSLEDRDLLSIRGRGHFARTLHPMSERLELIFEYLNYGLALVGLAVIWLIRRHFRLRNRQRFEALLSSISSPSLAEEARL